MAAATILMLVVLAQESVESLLTRAVLAERDGRLEEAARSYREVGALLPQVAAIPFNLALEKASVPQVADIVAGVRSVTGSTAEHQSNR